LKVFISHSSLDSSIAVQIGASLQSQGVDTWLAGHEVAVGANYAAEIYEAIKTTDCLLLLLTPHSQKSEHVKREVNLALSAGRRLLPVSFTDDAHQVTSLSGEWAYWLGVVQIHWANGIGDAVNVVMTALGIPKDGGPSFPIHPVDRQGEPSHSRAPKLATPEHSLRHEAQIRSALIQIAASNGTFQIAIERAKRFGASRKEVVAVAEHLRQAKLLRFDGELGPETVIRLN
jgi:hypothetical protein